MRLIVCKLKPILTTDKMKIPDIVMKSAKPELYERGTSFMWTDKHITRQLLNIHLNPDIDMASRKMESIKATVNWITDTQEDRCMEILDLGCGPGIYTELFAEKGHRVTGVDISGTSIEYAKNQAIHKNLDILYLNANYLDLQLEKNKYDLVTLIYTDLGVLLPSERDRLIHFVYGILKKGGIFVFDVLNQKDFEHKQTPKNWEAANSGFWRDIPYVVLSESFTYPENNVILYQHIVFDESGNLDVYRFWTHFFSHTELKKILIHNNFRKFSFHEDVLSHGDLWNGDNVTFCLATKE